MATIAETIETLTKLKYNKALLDYLVEHIDNTFLVSEGAAMVLLTEDKLRVSKESIEKFVEMLASMQKNNVLSINEILTKNVKE